MAYGKYGVNDSFELIGAFWDSAKPEEKFTGTLSSKRGKLRLVSAPIYGEANIEAVNRAITSDVLPKVDGLCGFTSAGNCSLLSAVLFNEGGLNDFSTGQRVTNKDYRISAAVMGMHVNSPDERSLDGAAFYLSKLNHLVPSPWSMTLGADKNTYVAPSKALNVFSFKNEALGAQIICEVFAGGGTSFQKEAVVKSVPRIRVVPDQPQSVEWFSETAFRVENFLSMCLGISVRLRQFQLFRADKDAWLVSGSRSPNEGFNYQMRVRCSPSALGQALDKWLSVPEANRPVEMIVLGMLRKSKVFVETEFLSLAQALEGFNRLQGSDPDKKFRKRLDEIYDMLSPDFALSLLGKRQDFAETVVATRNFFTHVGIAPKTSVVQDGGDLFDLNQRLHALLRCVMLLQLGIDESVLREPIRYQARRWRLR